MRCSPSRATACLARCSPPTGCSLVLEPRPLLIERPEPHAAARLWTDGESWRLQVGDDPPRGLDAGDTFTLGPRTFRAIGVPIDRAGQRNTSLKEKLHAPLRLVTHYDAMELHRDGEPTLTVGGISARILAELADFGAPVEWEILAGQVWPDGGDRAMLRRKLDVSLSRLRARLRSAGVRPDLVQSDGTGKVALLLYEGDTVDNRN